MGKTQSVTEDKESQVLQEAIRTFSDRHREDLKCQAAIQDQLVEAKRKKIELEQRIKELEAAEFETWVPAWQDFVTTIAELLAKRLNKEHELIGPFEDGQTLICFSHDRTMFLFDKDTWTLTIWPSSVKDSFPSLEELEKQLEFCPGLR